MVTFESVILEQLHKYHLRSRTKNLINAFLFYILALLITLTTPPNLMAFAPLAFCIGFLCEAKNDNSLIKKIEE